MLVYKSGHFSRLYSAPDAACCNLCLLLESGQVLRCILFGRAVGNKGEFWWATRAVGMLSFAAFLATVILIRHSFFGVYRSDANL